MAFCCVCAGVCNHIGNHSFCDEHKPEPRSHRPKKRKEKGLRDRVHVG